MYHTVFEFLIQADESLGSELEVDVREECVKLGPIDSIKVSEIFLAKLAYFYDITVTNHTKQTIHAIETLHWFVFSASW